MARWIIFEDHSAYSTPLAVAAKARSFDVEIYSSVEDRSQLVVSPGHAFDNVVGVYYDLFLTGEKVTGRSIEYLDALTALRMEEVEKLLTLQHLLILSSKYPHVEFVVSTQYWEVNTVRNWLLVQPNTQNVRLVPKPTKSASRDVLEQWCNFIFNPEPIFTSSSLRWLLCTTFVFKNEQLGNTLRNVLGKLGYDINGDRITSYGKRITANSDKKKSLDHNTKNEYVGSQRETDDATETQYAESKDIIKRTQSVDMVWFEVFEENGKLNELALRTLQHAVDVCPFTNFYIPVLHETCAVAEVPRDITCWPRVRFMGLNGTDENILQHDIKYNVRVAERKFSDSWGDSMFLGRSNAIAKLRQEIEQARKAKRIIIVGKTGTGKEAIWQMLLRRSARSNKKWCIVSGAQFTEELYRNEFYGNVEGAFTGARRGMRPGYLKETNGGTLIIDEMQDFPKEQWKSLKRVIEYGDYTPMGTTQGSQTDMHWILIANVEIEELIQRGQMDNDVWGRFKKASGRIICVPPLVERREDISILADYFLYVFTKQQSLIGVSIEPDALEFMENAYDWPENIRELCGVIESCVIPLSNREIITKSMVRGAIEEKPRKSTEEKVQKHRPDKYSSGIIQSVNRDSHELSKRERSNVTLSKDNVYAVEVKRTTLAEYLAAVLIATNLDKSAAAEPLGVDERTLDELLNTPEVRTQIVDCIVREKERLGEKCTVGEVSSVLLPVGKRTVAYRKSYVVYIQDKKVLDWLHGQVCAEYSTMKPDLKRVGKVIEKILREKAVAEGNVCSLEEKTAFSSKKRES